MATQFAGAPLDELRAWVRIAHQREAMVTELYELSHLDTRLEEAASKDEKNDPSGCAGVIRSAVASIWAHEESHTHFLASLRSLTEAFPNLAALQGKLEGRITLGAVSGSALAQVLIAVGASLGQAPDFARDLARMNLRQLLEFHGELETTARMGYLRILELCREVQYGTTTRNDFGYTLAYDVARILAEENFHEQVFAAMSGWIASGAESFAPIPSEACVRVLHGLCERNLALSAVSALLAAPTSEYVPKGEPPDGGWISHGGLGDLFAQYALSVPVLDAGAAADLLGG